MSSREVHPPQNVVSACHLERKREFLRNCLEVETRRANGIAVWISQKIELSLENKGVLNLMSVRSDRLAEFVSLLQRRRGTTIVVDEEVTNQQIARLLQAFRKDWYLL